jgi:Tol biopolymer transport system component
MRQWGVRLVLFSIIFFTACKKEKHDAGNTILLHSAGTHLLFDQVAPSDIGQMPPPYYSSLYYCKLDGSGQTRLTTPPTGYSDYRAAASFDGKHVIFTRTNTGDSGRGLYEIDVTGSNLKTIAKGSYVDYASFSPDGMQVAYVKNLADLTNPQDEIYTASADGSNEKKITTYAVIGDATHIYWAENGKLYFTTGGTGALTTGIYSCNPDGSNTQLVVADGYISSVSADAKYLLYETINGLYYSDINGGNPKLILSPIAPKTPATGDSPAYPEGAAFTTDDKQVYFYFIELDLSTQGIYKINIDGSGLTKVMDGLHEDPSIF